MAIFDEFRRRNVHRVALGYRAGAWLLIQIADTVFPRIGLGETAITRVYAWTGQNDLAFEWLDKMVDRHGPDKIFDVKTEFYDPIKSDPHWPAFLKKHGAEDQDLSHIEFNPQLPATNWKPAELRPASNP